MEVVEQSERWQTAREFATQVAMAILLFVGAGWAYGKISPLIYDDSIPLPLRFADEPTVEDHLPDNFVSPSDFDLAQSRFVAETPDGFQYWLLASTEETGELCLYVRLIDGSGALTCSTLDEFAFTGIAVGYAFDPDSSGGNPLLGAGRYLAEGMETPDPVAEAVVAGRFSFVEGESASFGDVIESFAAIEITGGTDLPGS